MNKVIRWGFLGCGKVVQAKSGEAFRKVPNSTITAIMGRDIEKAKVSAKNFGALEWCDSVEELLAKEIDAVYIATPPGLHYEQAMACLAAKKPVYLEKPFARNYTEAKAITDAFEEAGVPLYIAHYRRALPLFLKVRELLNANAIGEVTGVDFYLNRIFSPKDAEHGWLYHLEMSGGGKFYDIAPHTVDIINFLFGDIVKVQGKAENIGTGCPLENIVMMSFETEKGISGTAKFNCVAEEKSDRMYVTGTAGIMEFSAHGKNDVIIKDPQGNVLEQYELPDPKVVEQPMVQTVVEDLLGIGVCESKAREVLVTYDIIDRVLGDFYGGRSDDFWNHPERYRPCK
ncbi:MAG: Gfo/Idh/MocA family oxidoreductase [Lachnospiraceae bacterium]|nr:Gfo/Idh/MocA family oxidoreductase [Lachnospiraceae bacterium]